MREKNKEKKEWKKQDQNMVNENKSSRGKKCAIKKKIEGVRDEIVECRMKHMR